MRYISIAFILGATLMQPPAHAQMAPQNNLPAPECPMYSRQNGEGPTESSSFVCGEVPGGGEGGGGGQVPAFDPPAMATPQEILPGVLVNPNLYQTCAQFPHVFTGFSNDLQRGTPLYLTGVVAPGTYVVFGFYNQFGQLADLQLTTAARNNCVIHHEENAFSTSRLAPGYYTLYANYVTISPPGTPPIFGGSFPPGFNFYVTVNGYQNSVSMRYVTTIRIR